MVPSSWLSPSQWLETVETEWWSGVWWTLILQLSTPGSGMTRWGSHSEISEYVFIFRWLVPGPRWAFIWVLGARENIPAQPSQQTIQQWAERWWWPWEEWRGWGRRWSSSGAVSGPGWAWCARGARCRGCRRWSGDTRGDTSVRMRMIWSVLKWLFGHCYSTLKELLLFCGNYKSYN